MGVVNEEAEKETLRIDMLFELIQDLLLKVERGLGGEREEGREGGREDYNREREEDLLTMYMPYNTTSTHIRQLQVF